MRLVIQRVSRAAVLAGGEEIGSIDRGLAILLGVHEADEEADAIELAEKVYKLRVFADENGKMNLSAAQAGGDFLVISQFTLFADTSRGNRPSFIHAASPELGERLYRRFTERLRELGARVETGKFGNEMLVSLDNDGPVTVILDSGGPSRNEG